MTSPTVPLVATADLATTDFDVGVTVPGAITLKVATTTTPGKVARLATAIDIANGAAGPVVDAAGLKVAIANQLGNFQGGWNAATNTPALLSGQGSRGYIYKVTTAGVSIATTATAATTTATISVASATGLATGQLVTGTGVPTTTPTTIVAISGTSVTLSQPVSIAANAALTFATYLDGAGPFYPGDLVEFVDTLWVKLDGNAETSVNVTNSFGTHLYFAAP